MGTGLWDAGVASGLVLSARSSGEKRMDCMDGCARGAKRRQRLMPSKLAAMPRANSDQSKPSASAT
jgi:hypothetical protein